MISNGELKAVNHDLDHSTTQFLVGNVLSLTGGVDEVWMKPQLSAALKQRDHKQGSSTCLTNACSVFEVKVRLRKEA